MTLIGEVPPGLAATAARIGDATTVLDEDQVTGFVQEQLAAHPFDGRSVCVLVPDATRTCPLPLLLRAVHGALHGRVSRLTVLVALGTHAPMGEEALAVHLGYEPGRLEETYPGTTVVNHEWWKPETFADLGTVPASRIVELSEGRMDLDVPVLLNRAVVEHDVALVLGPVLPHEVVGISGGNKYFFPGVAGQKIIDVSHWLGALITSAEIIGTTGITPVRALIDDGAALIPSEKLALCAVTAEVADGAVDGAVDATVDLTGPDQRAALGVVRRHPGVVGVGGRGLRGHPRHVPRRTGAPGAVDRPRDVRRDLDRRQGLLQARTGGRRRRRGDPLRPAHPRDLLHPQGDLRHRLPLPRLLREAVGPVLPRALGRAGALDAPARRRHLRRGHRARSGCAWR